MSYLTCYLKYLAELLIKNGLTGSTAKVAGNFMLLWKKNAGLLESTDPVYVRVTTVLFNLENIMDDNALLENYLWKPVPLKIFKQLFSPISDIIAAAPLLP